MDRKLNILYILNDYSPMNGCVYVRNILPARELDKMGHHIQFMLYGKNTPQDVLDLADIVVFSRHYDRSVDVLVKKLKDMKKKIVYEIDDDLDTLLRSNAIRIVEENLQANIKSIKGLTIDADLITTSTQFLADKMSKESGKPAVVIPNYIDFDFYKPRKHASKELRIGWSGGGTHATDLFYFVDVIGKLRKKHKFSFYMQGITSSPFAGYIENWRVALSSGLWDNTTLHKDIQVYIDLFHKLEKDKIEYIHVPYYPITMFPSIMADVDLDIGVCPLIDTEFSRSKSCNKFYEYAALDTVTVASDVIPYSEEVTYLAKNTPDLQDWYDKLERLIKDKKFRNTVLLSQKLWVASHRDAKHCGKAWEEAFSSIV